MSASSTVILSSGFYNDVAFFRTVPNFMVQFGIPGNPRLASKWQGASKSE
jgi:cyclophilin family peptidyl-prolyl cis-trans isomerase